MAKILLLQGPPACGKTSFRKQFIEDNPEWTYVSMDELRLANPDLPEHEHIEHMWSNAHTYILQGKSFIVDNTNLNTKTVNKWQLLASNNHYDFEIKQFMDVPYEVAVIRDAERSNSVGKSVIWKMFVDAGIQPRNYKKEAIIFDIDGTVADLSNRRRHITNEPKKDWKNFFREIDTDVPIEAVKFLYDIIRRTGITIIFVSGRPSEYRSTTQRWLIEHGFTDWDLLLMRPFNDKRDDTIIKEEIYERYIEPFFTVKAVFDDRDRVVRMWRNKGLQCYQVNYGDF